MLAVLAVLAVAFGWVLRSAVVEVWPVVDVVFFEDKIPTIPAIGAAIGHNHARFPAFMRFVRQQVGAATTVDAGNDFGDAHRWNGAQVGTRRSHRPSAWSMK